ncbi:MAG: hypothetical protein ACR2PA_02125 [Hyphomicrobiaceae bacterium]
MEDRVRARSRNFSPAIDADDVPKHVAEQKAMTEERFAEAIEAFLNFEAQRGWPANHFTRHLVCEFIESGLMEIECGSFNWTPEMHRYFDHVIAVPWDPNELFERICGSWPE